MGPRRWLAAAWLLWLSAPALAQTPSAVDPRACQRVVGILQYLQSDYPDAVRSHAPSELDEQKGFAQEALETAQQLGPGASAYLPRLQSVARRIGQAQDPEGVSHDCAALVDQLSVAGGLARSPRRPPDFAHAAEVYAVACAACHGADGSARVDIAAAMTPKPSNFLAADPMDQLTPFKAFNVETLGVSGTAMPDYTLLDESDRWALAFYLFTLRQPPCETETPRATLELLANTSDADLAKSYTPAQIACLRRRPPEVDEERSLLIARGGIDDAVRLAHQGQAQAARQAVVDAYLNGVEPVEVLLRARAPALVDRLEAGFTQLRVDTERGSPSVSSDAREVSALIDLARRGHSPTDALSVFVLTLGILLREGFEATVVIAALLAVLKKTGQTQHFKVVHAGWALALALGIGAFAFARHLLAGTRHEWMEAVVALLAVGMLLYAALWLNARKNTRKFMGHLRQQMEGALGSGSVAGLFTIAFTAMLRESFETALFLQGLSIDSPVGVAWGSVAGAALVVAFVTFVVRFGYRLPMKALFNGSTVLLFATAVILLGKGLHALQELGALSIRPIRFVTVDFLGIYPDLLSLVPQALLALAPFVWWWLGRYRPGPPPLEALPDAKPH
jgi:high-affinity iron transporter